MLTCCDDNSLLFLQKVVSDLYVVCAFKAVDDGLRHLFLVSDHLSLHYFEDPILKPKYELLGRALLRTLLHWLSQEINGHG